ncbi:hypothetical protein Vafri_19327 [Volvox africanus]|uniref:Eukaryotic translation initiation factor 3 30 kDa subunit n=1 Tax=Volvox africanus TaxID=51714 RepID=A0A8J4F9J1_9CHLO|nr:hypothetical protein Vafri_19327 [Volvox africanus]
MADDLDDWETADIESDLSKPTIAAVKPAPVFETKGEAILAKINGPDMSQFEDEDTNFSAPVEHSVPAPQPKKKEEKKYREERVMIDTPLDDPIAEKLRQQKLVEQADYESARDLFGGVSTLRPLESYLPKTLKEFEDFTVEIVSRHVVVHRESKHYKAFVKALIKAAVEPLGPEEVKDLETCLAGVRSDKAKKKKEEEEKKKGVKKTLNMGKQGISAGLDDYVYEDNLDGDDDFM